MKHLRFVLYLLLIAGIFTACENNISYSGNPNDKLHFSADTLRFDTVFTTVGSATKLLKVYNPNKQALIIENIRLENHPNSGFRMNVDGMSGAEFSNIEILSGDSLFVFVEVTVNPTSVNNPVLIEDHIRFRRAGAEQAVLLEAYGQDAHIWRKKIIDKDTTFTGEKPFLLYDSLIVNRGVTLTIEENARFFFHRDVGFFVNGAVIAQGTVQHPIVFRGDRSDNLVGDISYDLAPGQWQGIEIDSLSFGNHFENVRIRNAKIGLLCKPSVETQKKAILTNVVIHNNSSDGLSANNCDIDAYNSQITNAGGTTVRLTGGKYDFIHCTIANHFNWEPRRGATLALANKAKDTPIPLLSCRFVNTIIDGSQVDEISYTNSDDSTPFNYLFVSCQIKAKIQEINKPNYVNVLWATTEKTFRRLNEENDRIYDFRLDSLSVAINAADRQYSLTLPLDLNGVSRLSDTAPDMGCYEFVKE